MRFLYSIFIWLSVPVVLLRLYWRSFKLPAYRRRIGERLAIHGFKKTQRSVIWLHAVSFGEMAAAQPMVKLLVTEYPDYQILITNTTPTGSDLARKAFGEQVLNCYLPLDLPGAVKRFLKHVEPQLCVIMETELWPNLLYYTAKANIPIILANARLSLRSFRGYRYIAHMAKQMMHQLTMVAAQTPEDGERFIQLGLSAKQLTITGNIKFDMDISEHVGHEAMLLRRSWGVRPVWIAASTHQGEEKEVLLAHRELLRSYPDALLVLVPRHPDRFVEVANLCIKEKMSYIKRSLGEVPQSTTQVFLVDTMGELKLFYALCDVAFVGGSLVAAGGHNMLEAAAFAKPILSGPKLDNFVAISSLLIYAEAMLLVNDYATLSESIKLLFQDHELAQRMGEAAFNVVKRNRGALDRHMLLIASLLKRALR